MIVTPSTTNEVAKVLAVCRFLQHKFSVRGGGHLQIPGFTSNEDGVVISLSKFSQVVVSDDKSTVDIGVGLRWLDVYKALDPYSLAVVGGRMPTVGVPGLLLGGGISFQNSEYGLGCMNIVNYEVFGFPHSSSFRNKAHFNHAGCSRKLLDRHCQRHGKQRPILGIERRWSKLRFVADSAISSTSKADLKQQ